MVFMLMRVGEAQHPGPIIGAMNPTGLHGKGELLNQLPQNSVWGITETHLSHPGLVKFRTELHHTAPSFRIIPGAPAPLVTQTVGAIGGKHTGVAVLSDGPVRAMTNDWKSDIWDTGRVQCAATLLDNTWIKMGVAYGYASNTYTRDTMDKTDTLLHALTERIVYKSCGPRVICGDFNHSKDSLEQFSTWRQHGWVELQEYAWQKWQQPVQPTNRQGNVIDHLWISPELIPLLRAVHVESSWFPDHNLLYAEFADLHPSPPVPIWRKPQPLPWDDVGELDDTLSFRMPVNDPQPFAAIFHELETRVHASLLCQGKPGLLPQQRGRCRTSAPTWKQAQVTPLKPSRKHETPVTYLGENFTHVQWCRQMRRLQSLVSVVESPQSGQNHVVHRTALWKSIRRASGFPKGFPFSWRHRSVWLPNAPIDLPVHCPDANLCRVIFETFRLEFQQLERSLKAARLHCAKDRRRQDRNVAFRDVAKPKSMPVQTLVRSKSACVTDVSEDRLSISYAVDALAVSEPVFGPSGLLPVQQHTPGQLRVKHETALEPGDLLVQDVFVGKVQEIFADFQALWSPMWNRHGNCPVDHWDPFLLQLQQCIPMPAQSFAWKPITTEEWVHAIRTRKPTSATGPDGVSRLDLLHLPHDLQQTVVGVVNAIETGSMSWPDTALQGLITSLEKHDKAKGAGDFRPICVLSQIYRTWGSIRSKQILQFLDEQAPDHLIGNRPNKSTKHIWYALAQEIEIAHATGRQMGGVITDVVKCFNNIPRPIIAFIARHLTLPGPLVRCWHQALDKLARRFVIQGCCSEPVFSTNGYPEGDGMSVVAMCLLNFGLHAWVEQGLLATQVWSYVDNWELVTTNIRELPTAVERLQSFADQAGLQLDQRKTFAWALSSADRTQLRQMQFQVEYDARDLGGHVAYCKKKTMGTLRARIQGNAMGWTWLARSCAPIEQKLSMLHTVFWPRLLHGISGLWISAEHTKKLRCMAMQCLGWKRKGASSVIQIGLHHHTMADPGYYSLTQTILDFRRLSSLGDIDYTVCAIAHGEYPRYPPGPIGAFLHRLHEIGWSWEAGGFLTDHHGMSLHIQDSPIQLLTLRLREAWGFMIGGQVSDRKSFAGMQHVDLHMSHLFEDEWPPDQAGFLRAARNGTFFTRDAQVYSAKAPNKHCAFCGELDSVEHRHWDCPQFHAQRKHVSSADMHALLQLPECCRVRGWMTHSLAHLDFVRSLDSVPDTTSRFGCDAPLGPLHLFTDGSCANPGIAPIRLASWAVVVGCLDTQTFLPVSSGGVCGGLQTIVRAEITAALSAVLFGLHHGKPFYVWVDNQQVYNALKDMKRSAFQSRTPMHKDHDLWNQLFWAVQKAGDLFQQPVKVRSHEDIAAYGCHVEQWAIQGNDRADSEACTARLQLPHNVMHAWHKWQRDYMHRKHLTYVMQKLIIDIGLHAVAFRKLIARADDETWDHALTGPREHEGEIITHQGIPALTCLPKKHTMRQIVDHLHSWLGQLTHGATVQPFWVTSAHLLIHLQMHTTSLGYKFNQATNQWNFVRSHVEEHGFDFAQTANWLQAAIRCFARLTGMPYKCYPRLPDGTCYRCWTPSLLIALDPEVFWTLDRALRQRGASAISSVRKSFKGWKPFDAASA